MTRTGIGLPSSAQQDNDALSWEGIRPARQLWKRVLGERRELPYLYTDTKPAKGPITECAVWN
jgi:hypothetical protein